MEIIHIKLLATAMFAAISLGCHGQEPATENPRGLYKMTKLTGRGDKEIDAPFDQYKICEDNSTITFIVQSRGTQNSEFRFFVNDRRVLNYTGTEPQGEDGRGTQIYQSDGQQFHLKWWSRTKNHRYFPENGWVDEKYELNRTSPHAKNILDLLRNTTWRENKHPFGGRWVMVGNADREERAKEIANNPDEGESTLTHMVIVQNQMLKFSYWGTQNVFSGNIYPCPASSKDELRIDNRSYQVQWEGQHLFYYKNHKGVYEIWQRDESSTPCYDMIANQLARRSPQEKAAQQEEEQQPLIVPKYREPDPDARENPRGVYKLMALLDKYNIIIKEPYDQYKICTDSMTLQFTMEGNTFILTKNDKAVFNYTGEEPDAHDATATRIFDSNAEHFTEKWWSTTQGHLYFPHNGWCTEYYESGKYSENARLILDALMSPPHAYDPKHPLVGAWQFIGLLDDLFHSKKKLKMLRKETRQAASPIKIYSIFTPTHAIATGGFTGVINNLEVTGKKSFTTNGTEHKFTWLSKDCIAVEVKGKDLRIDYQIMERVTDPTPILNKTASLFMVQ